MYEEQHDDAESLRVVNPYPEMPVLHTPESLADRPSSVRRKLPTPPLIDPRRVEEHINQTMERIPARKTVRQHMGGAHNNESDSDLSVAGMQNLMSITAPVVSGRRRVAANFQGVEHQATGDAVMSMALPREDVSAPAVSVIALFLKCTA